MTNTEYHLSYKPLWKLLIDRNLTRQDLRHLTGLSSATMAKLGRGANVTTEVLLKICVALKCELNDIVEIEYQEIKGLLPNSK